MALLAAQANEGGNLLGGPATAKVVVVVWPQGATANPSLKAGDAWTLGLKTSKPMKTNRQVYGSLSLSLFLILT